MYSRVYMVGIGGIGMSALAQFLLHHGAAVSGMDREQSPMTDLLQQKGIDIQFGHAEGRVTTDTEVLIYSDAVSEEVPERQQARSLGIRELSYFDALGELTTQAKTIAVAGTHGKTTTTGMLGKILQATQKDPTVIVGSLIRDFSSNFLPGRPDLFVLEACEYRDHLLKLHPTILVITNIELDHTDYFKDLAALQNTFKRAIEQVPADGVIVTNPSDPVIAAVLSSAVAPIIDYTTQTVPRLGLIGEFNRHNARAAKAAARAAFPHLQEEFIDKALIGFEGSWRRFEYRGETSGGAIVFDDYAHHPTAVRATLEAAREAHPDKRLVVAFHPHLYSRTKSFLDEFASALAVADEVLVAPIYAAREESDPTISHQVLAERIVASGGSAEAIHSFEDIRDILLKKGSDVIIITMGAGDIYKVADQITDQ